MAMTKEDILDAVSKMNVVDLCDLVKMLEEKFGVSAQMLSPTLPMQTDSKEKASQDEKTEFDVVLVASGKNKISAIKAVRAATSLGLKESKEAVENVPFTVKSSLSKSDAEALKKQIEESGAEVKIK